MNPVTRLRTGRLELRPAGAADADALHRLWTREPVRRYLWDGGRVAPERTCAIVERNELLFAESGLGIWMARDDDGSVVGFVGYWHFREPPQLELLAGVDPRRWGRGIATEAARAVIRYAFEQLGFERIAASTDAANAAAVGLIDKLGMRFVRRATIDGLDTLFYVLQHETGE